MENSLGYKKGLDAQKLLIYGDGLDPKIYLFDVSSDSPKAYQSLNGFDFKKIDFNKELYQRLCQEKKQADNFIAESKKEILSLVEVNHLDNLHLQEIIPFKKDRLFIYHLRSEEGSARVHGLLMGKKAKSGVLWNSVEPIWETPKDWLDKDIYFIQLISFRNRLISYWLVKSLGIFAVAYPHFRLGQIIKLSQRCHLCKPETNPLIVPRQENSWEAFNTFNPAAVYEAEKVHILYRAQGWDYFSSVGYASSKDGLTIQERLNEPVFDPRDYSKFKLDKPKYKYVSGGGWGGCEDPRVTKIDNRIYMTYVAFDGYSPPRIALTSISLADFLNHKWLWEKPVLISPPGVVDKSACILPEKINGKYVIFHRIFPNILVDYVDSLEFDGVTFLKGEHKIPPRPREWWDSRKVGAGAPPVKTPEGWLLIYQAVDDKDASHYKVGAMLLDLKNPSKVLYRSHYPIIKPDKFYEHDGFKAGVVYPCGAVVVKETLLVYYGAADSYVCVASANLADFVDNLMKQKQIILMPAKIKKINDLSNS